MNPLYLLDTNIVSALIRAKNQRLEKRFQSIPIAHVSVSSVVRAELMYELKSLPSSHPLHGEVRFFMKAMRVLPWDEACADRYAEVCYKLTSAGEPIGEFDMMIAAHALALDATLVTNNADRYKSIPLPLKIENWG